MVGRYRVSIVGYPSFSTFYSKEELRRSKAAWRLRDVNTLPSHSLTHSASTVSWALNLDLDLVWASCVRNMETRR